MNKQREIRKRLDEQEILIARLSESCRKTRELLDGAEFRPVTPRGQRLQAEELLKQKRMNRVLGRSNKILELDVPANHQSPDNK